jgi:aspartate kinase
MAGAGAKVVHLRAVELAANHDIPMQVRSSFDYSSDGTKITTSSRSLEAPVISTISNTIDDAKISIRRVPEKQGIEAAIFTPLASAGIAVDTIVKNVGRDGFSEIAFTIGKANLKRALQLSENVAKKVGAGEVEVSCDLAKVSIVGVGMRSHIGVPAKIFDVISKNGIKIHIISSSEIKTSVVIDMKDMERAVRVLHEAFEPGRH